MARDGKVVAELALPVAGLMSLMSFEEVREALIPLRAAAKGLGVTLPEPFLQVAFLPLPVIPHLKITDMGLGGRGQDSPIRPGRRGRLSGMFNLRARPD